MKCPKCSGDGGFQVPEYCQIGGTGSFRGDLLITPNNGSPRATLT